MYQDTYKQSGHPSASAKSSFLAVFPEIQYNRFSLLKQNIIQYSRISACVKITAFLYGFQRQ
ncbi:MAG TPA: hypothetical protein PL163_24470, partial [Leptospiraceae bacterium]|nr:hypothetical protein [Leptospiraceae bacterium]